MGENILLFDAVLDTPLGNDSESTTQPTHHVDPDQQQEHMDNSTTQPTHHVDPDQQHNHANPPIPVTTEMIEPRRSTHISQPSGSTLQSREYQEHEELERREGQDWATERKRPHASCVMDQLSFEQGDYIACLMETKALHHIPHSYCHAMTTDPNRWMIPMQVEMDTLKGKHTWDLVKPPPGVNIMDSRWVYDIKWDGEGNRIKDKARVVGKGYTQQLGVYCSQTQS